MNDAVLDSSALLALLLNEPGADVVQSVLPGALMSTVNYAETVGKLAERGVPVDVACEAIAATGTVLVDFDPEQAALTGALRPVTRAAGLSLGDRACLALSRLRDLPALTTDTAWGRLPGVRVTVIRDARTVRGEA